MSDAANLSQAPSGTIRPAARWLAERYSLAWPWKFVEIAIGIGVFLLIWYVLAVFLWTDIYRHTDTTQLVALTESTGRYGVPYNSLGGSVVQAAALWGSEAQAVCADSLEPGPESYPNRRFNHLEYHAYYFAYALAPLTWFLPTSVVIAGTQALAMALVLGLAYLVLRQERVNPVGAVFFVGLVACYPVWNGALIQDLYMDRYFPPLALLYVALLYYALVAPGRPWAPHWKWAIPIGVAAASTNDRSILYAIGITVGIIALMGRSALVDRRDALLLLVGFCVLLGVGFLYYQTQIHTSTINTIPQFSGLWFYVIQQFVSPIPFRWDQTYAELTLKFLIVNAVLFGIWGVFRWRLMVLALGAMLPNIATTIGGAEKLSFGLHYHSLYLPMVLFASALGFGAVWRRVGSWVGRIAVAAVASMLAICLLTLDPYKPGLVLDTSNALQSGLHATWLFYSYGDQGPVVAHRRVLDELASAVPKDASVTGMDNLLPPFYAQPGIYFYPIGIDQAQYAVLSIETDSAGNRYFGGAVSYRGEGEALNKCLTQRLERDGYDVHNPRIVGPYAILRRG